MAKQPQVKNYQNVHLFLQDIYAFRKRQDATFSYAIWTKELGLGSRAYLRAIILGERPLNQRLIDILIRNFDFSDEDADYFFTLVNYNQSKNREQKRVFGKKILSYHASKEDFLDVENHYDFVSSDLLPRLQTLLSFEDMPDDPASMAFMLGVSEAEILQGLKDLQKFGMVETRGDKWKPIKKSWKLPNNFNDIGLREFYIENLKNAERAIDAYEPSERRFRSLFAALNPEEFQDFLKDFEAFVQEQLVKRNVDQLGDRRLYQLNFNFFPSSRKSPKI